MADSGLKISQPFYDAKSAGDVNLLFSSSWPSIQIVKDKTFTVSSVLGGAVYSYPSQTVSHDLGYQFSMCWESTGGVAVRANNHLSINNGSVTWTSSTSSASPLPDLSLNVKVYNIDITKKADYPFVRPPGYTAAYNNDFGIKFAKKGKRVDSVDMRDFILHSRCPSPAVLSVVPGTTTAKYSNSEGYTAWVFGYGSHSGGAYQWAGIGAQAFPKLFVDKPAVNSFEIDGSPGDLVSLVVLRDPLFAATNVSVTY